MELKTPNIFCITLFCLIAFSSHTKIFADYNLEEDKMQQIFFIEDQISRLNYLIELNDTKLSLYEIEMEKINQGVILLVEFIKATGDSQLAAEIETDKIEVTDIEKYNDNLGKLKDSFKQKIIWLYKYGPNYEKEMLFTSENIGNFYARLKYLNRISELRKKDLDKIVKINYVLEEKKKLNKLRSSEKNRYILEKRQEQMILVNKTTAIEKEMNNLNDLNDEYKRLIEKKQREIARINSRIQFMKDPFIYKINQTVDYTSDDFENLRGKLILPVNSVDIISDFGTFINSETFTESYSSGITVSIVKNSEVKAVADGIVEDVNFIPQFGNIVVIKHNDGYRTLYGTVEPLPFLKGKTITAGEIIARTSVSSNGQSFHFEIWKDKTPLDPKFWFRRG